MFWSDTDLMKLRSLWPTTAKEILEETFSRSYALIYKKAKKLNIADLRPKDLGASRRIGNLEILLNGSSKSWYWIGFILADGCVKGNHLQVLQSLKDKDHLEKFASYVGSKTREMRGNDSKGYSNLSVVAISQPLVISKLRDLLGLQDRKSYNPPTKLEVLTQDQLLWVLAGFIDGDGCISVATKNQYKSYTIKISCHISWLPVFELWSRRLSNLPFKTPFSVISRSRTRNGKLEESAHFNKSSLSDLKWLKSFYQASDLPLLDRKWSLIP